MNPAAIERLKRCLLAGLVGGGIASVPWLASLTENDRVTAVTGLILLPGIIPGMLAGGGGVHDTSWPVTIWASVVFWISIAYIGLARRAKARSGLSSPHHGTERTKATELLASGIALLDSVMAANGFVFVPKGSGRGSGGEFAWGEFRRGNRAMELHFRYSLGLVRYHIGASSIIHEDYMWSAIGKRHASEYPGFSADPLDGFRHLLHDLERYGTDFLQGGDAEFTNHIQRAEQLRTGANRLPKK